MKKLNKTIVTTFAVAASIAVVGGAVAAEVARRTPPPSSSVSPVTKDVGPGLLTAGDRAALASAGAADDVRIVGEAAGIRFFVANGDRGRCYISGPLGQGAAIGTIACLDRSNENFPSRQQPILDLSAYRGEPAPSSRLFVQWLAGFAADGVAAVSVVTADGSTVTARVRNNVYGSDSSPPAPVVKLVASDAAGNVLWSRPFAGPPPPPVP